MSHFLRKITIGFLLMFWLIGCQIEEPDLSTVPTPTVYQENQNDRLEVEDANLGYIVGETLDIIDTSTLEIVRTVPFPSKPASGVHIDGQNRLWIPFIRQKDFHSPGNQVNVYSKDGHLIKELTTCDHPEGVYFSSDYAFIICSHTGFEGLVELFDLNSFESQKRILMKTEDDSHLIRGAGINDKHLIVSANPLEQGAIMTLIDVEAAEIKETLNVFSGTMDVMVETILPYEGSFILLNMLDDYRDTAGDVVIVSPDNDTRIERIETYESPAFGFVHDHHLYAYHNRYPFGDPEKDDEFNPYHDGKTPKISKYDLQTGELQLWDAPRLILSDMAWINDELILLVSSEDKEGLYRFDFESGEAERVLAVEYSRKWPQDSVHFTSYGE